MKIYHEIALRKFQPWAGAKSVFYRLTLQELDKLEEILDSDPAVYTDTDINDLFWFDYEWVLETLEINTEEFWNRDPAHQILSL